MHDESDDVIQIIQLQTTKIYKLLNQNANPLSFNHLPFLLVWIGLWWITVRFNYLIQTGLRLSELTF